MSDTPQPPVPFSQRLTPDIRRAWFEFEAANRKAKRAYEAGDTDQQTWMCEVCGKRTELSTRRHKKCEAAA